MAVGSDRSRRSFLAKLLTGAAGAWVTVTGLAAASSLQSGCPVAAKYGGPTTAPPPRRQDPADPPPPPPPAKKTRTRPERPVHGPVKKYGGRRR